MNNFINYSLIKSSDKNIEEKLKKNLIKNDNTEIIANSKYFEDEIDIKTKKEMIIKLLLSCYISEMNTYCNDLMIDFIFEVLFNKNSNKFLNFDTKIDDLINLYKKDPESAQGELNLLYDSYDYN